MTHGFKNYTFIIFGIIIFLAGGCDFISKSKPLPILGTIPNFSLTNSNGVQIGLDELRGKVWVADFIFTTCAGPCPVMSMHMSRLHDEFKDDERIRMVSITVNPDYDTPEVLTNYAKQYKARTDLWYFLTGSYEAIQSLVANGFKMGDTEDIVFHSTRFALVDQESRIRGYYTGTETDEMEKLIKDIVRLVQ